PAGALAAAAAGVAARYGPRRLRRWLPLVPGLLLAAVAAYIVAKTVRYPIPPDLNWPAAFAAVDPLAWAAVAAAVTQVIVTPPGDQRGPRPKRFRSRRRSGIGAIR